MGKSSRPTLRQLRGVYLLVGECCELGADPIAWRERMTQGLLGLLNGNVLVYSESEQVAPYGEEGWINARLLVDRGWPCQSDREPLFELLREGEPAVDGSWITPELVDSPTPVRVALRRELVDDPIWYRGPFFSDFLRRAHMDEGLLLQHRDGNEVNWFAFFRSIGEPEFDGRQLSLLKLFGREYRAMYGTRWAPAGGASVSDLPPRVRQVLVCLMEGDSEKQVALRLGISRHTVHDYVKELHHRFEVSSRGELLARCRKFWPVLTSGGPDAAANEST